MINNYLQKKIKHGKNISVWYSPDSGLWGDRYIDEKSDVLTDQRNATELNIIKKYIRGKKNILDIPCGYGRLSNALAELGYNVTGVDINKYFINIARKEARTKNLSVRYLVKDMLDYNPIKKFDVVLNIFTSLGYYNSESQNEEFINRLCGAVKPEGLLLIETINPINLLNKYKDKIKKTTRGGTKILFENSFDHKTAINTTRITEKRPDGKTNKVFHKIRLYYPHELIAACSKNGLEFQEILNENGRGSYIPSFKRMWLIFNKK